MNYFTGNAPSIRDLSADEISMIGGGDPGDEIVTTMVCGTDAQGRQFCEIKCD